MFSSKFFLPMARHRCKRSYQWNDLRKSKRCLPSRAIDHVVLRMKIFAANAIQEVLEIAIDLTRIIFCQNSLSHETSIIYVRYPIPKSWSFQDKIVYNRLNITHNHP